MLPSQFAAINQLAFGDRPEYNVVFVSFEWEDLVPLLSNPIAYLSAVSPAWGQAFPNQADGIEWALLSPVTVVMEWLGNSIEQLVKARNLARLKNKTDSDGANTWNLKTRLGHMVQGSINELVAFQSPSPANPVAGTPVSVEDPSPGSTMALSFRKEPGNVETPPAVPAVSAPQAMAPRKSWEDSPEDWLKILCKLSEIRRHSIKEALNTDFPTGVLLAEFSVLTHTLTVYYHPKMPSPCRFGGRMPGTTTMVRLGISDTPIDPRSRIHERASLHFDIGQSERERACFISDYLTDMVGSLRRCFGHHVPAPGAAAQAPEHRNQSGVGPRLSSVSLGAGAARFHVGAASYYEKGDQIVVNQPNQANLPDFQILESEFPTLIMDMSHAAKPAPHVAGDPSDPCQICILINGTYQPDPNVFYPGTTIVKCYVPPT